MAGKNGANGQANGGDPRLNDLQRNIADAANAKRDAQKAKMAADEALLQTRAQAAAADEASKAQAEANVKSAEARAKRAGNAFNEADADFRSARADYRAAAAGSGQSHSSSANKGTLAQANAGGSLAPTHTSSDTGAGLHSSAGAPNTANPSAAPKQPGIIRRQANDFVSGKAPSVKVSLGTAAVFGGISAANALYDGRPEDALRDGSRSAAETGGFMAGMRLGAMAANVTPGHPFLKAGVGLVVGVAAGFGLNKEIDSLFDAGSKVSEPADKPQAQVRQPAPKQPAAPAPQTQLSTEAKLLLAKAEKNDAAAANLVGIYYEQGSHGFPKNADQSRRWDEKAAELGSVPSQYNMALNYLYGKGVAKDSTLAAAWLLVADHNGSTDAKAMLASNKIQLSEKAAHQAEVNANVWLNNHSQGSAPAAPSTSVPAEPSTSVPAAPSASAAAGDNASTGPASPASPGAATVGRRWTPIEPDVQLALEKMAQAAAAAGDSQAANIHTGNKNHAAFLAGNATMDGKNGPKTAAAIAWFKAKHPDMAALEGDALSAKIKEEAAKLPTTPAASPSAAATDASAQPITDPVATASTATPDLKTMVAPIVAKLANVSDTAEALSISRGLEIKGIVQNLGINQPVQTQIMNEMISGGESEMVRGVERATGLSEDGKSDAKLIALLSDPTAGPLIAKAINAGSITAVAAASGTPSATPLGSAAPGVTTAR